MNCGCHSHNGYLLKGTRARVPFAQQYSLEGLATRGDPGYIDKVGSVSGLELERDFHVWDDELLNEQHRRESNGS